MLTQVIWWTTNALEAIVLGRGLQSRRVKAYPIFYTYLAYVLIESLSRFYVYTWHPTSYGHFYWSTQFASVLLGYGILWEICRQALCRYPGAFRMARTALALIFAIVISKVLSNVVGGESWSLARTTEELERDFRIVQAFLILAILGLLSFYRIPIGRNLRGMILGYGFFLGTSVINLTFRSYFGETFQNWWRYLQPTAYIVVLVIWCATLWSHQPNPEPKVEPRLEHDYQALVHSTRQRFRQVRAHVGRAARP